MEKVDILFELVKFDMEQIRIYREAGLYISIFLPLGSAHRARSLNPGRGAARVADRARAVVDRRGRGHHRNHVRIVFHVIGQHIDEHLGQ